MLPVDQFIKSLDYEIELLAGSSGAGKLCRDVLLLSDERVWLTRAEDSEFKNALVFVTSKVFPPYSSTFDLLLRFLRQAGAACILFQGGKRSDFSKATLMLADNLGLPLIWLNSSVSYSELARIYNMMFVQISQQTIHHLRQARSRIEKAFTESFSLSAWMNTIERELSVTADLRPTNTSDKNESKKTVWTQDGNRRALRIPIRVLDSTFQLYLVLNDPCPLFQPDSQQVWIDQIAGILASQTAYFLLAEVPGLATQSQWATSFESALYYAMLNLPMIHSNDLNESNNIEVDDAWQHKVIDSLSVGRRLRLVKASPVGSVSLLWVKGVGDSTQTMQPFNQVVERPFAYRSFTPCTLTLRNQVMTLFKQTRFSQGTQSALFSCVPWKDWRDNEGVLVFWYSFDHALPYPTENSVRELVHQLEARVQITLRAYFCREDVAGLTDPTQLLQRGSRVVEGSYADFMNVIQQSKTVQFAENHGDMTNLMIRNPNQTSSYDHALEVLKPLIQGKGSEVLLEAVETYLECGAKMQTAAEKLFLHRNTLRYRLNRAEKLLNINFNDDEIRFTYHVAIRIWRLKNPSPIMR